MLTNSYQPTVRGVHPLRHTRGNSVFRRPPPVGRRVVPGVGIPASPAGNRPPHSRVGTPRPPRAADHRADCPAGPRANGSNRRANPANSPAAQTIASPAEPVGARLQASLRYRLPTVHSARILPIPSSAAASSFSYRCSFHPVRQFLDPMAPSRPDRPVESAGLVCCLLAPARSAFVKVRRRGGPV
jgi:hypothetical protein